MKQRAPFDWRQSSSDGVRTGNQWVPGVVEETGLWEGRGGLLGAGIPERDDEPFFLFQKPVQDSEKKSFGEFHAKYISFECVGQRWTRLLVATFSSFFVLF